MAQPNLAKVEDSPLPSSRRTLIDDEADAIVPAFDPRDIVRRGAAVANELSRIIESQRMYTEIRGRRYVHVEGWVTCAAMLGVSPHEEYVNEDDNDGTCEAAVRLVRDSDGMIVGRASHICGGDDDGVWGERPRFARRSMAVTRATGKACRLKFSWIVKLAGFEPTPKEEMDHLDDDAKGNEPAQKPAPKKKKVQHFKYTQKKSEEKPEVMPMPEWALARCDSLLNLFQDLDTKGEAWRIKMKVGSPSAWKNKMVDDVWSWFVRCCTAGGIGMVDMDEELDKALAAACGDEDIPF